MEEKAINFFKEVWFNPPNGPAIEENIINKIKKEWFNILKIIIKGLSFCQVINK